VGNVEEMWFSIGINLKQKSDLHGVKMVLPTFSLVAIHGFFLFYFLFGADDVMTLENATARNFLFGPNPSC